MVEETIDTMEKEQIKQERFCPDCGQLLPLNAPLGLCPKCLVLCGVVERADKKNPTTTGQTVPSLEGTGAVIGPYKLLQQIGEGGFGIVYMAEQKQPVKRRVALKIIRIGMDTRQVIGRFEAERQALAMMDHPNIARVLDAGETDAGRPYFVMELVKGIPITNYCDNNKLTTTERLDLFMIVCRAIQHAHQKGIIHRDIKPSNILITLHDGIPVPKVIDFGIAKATQHELTEKTLFTQYGQFIGTPTYMSPEQAEMSGLDVDTRSDIYSLGVLLYELLTGKTPLDSTTLLSAGYDEIRRRIREEEPSRPSTRVSTLVGGELTAISRQRQAEPAKLRILLEGDLDWIVMRCLDKDRTRRYETANGLALDIKRHLDNEPVTAAAPSTVYQLKKFARRNQRALVTVGLVAGVLILGSIVSIWQAVRATQASANEKTARVQAEAAKNEADAQARRASAGELLARQVAYSSDMSLAFRALQDNDLGLARRLLNNHRPTADERDLRHWEWRALWKQCQGDSITSFGNLDRLIFTISLSPDGRWLATGGQWGEIRIWDMYTRQEVKTLASAHTTAQYSQVVFSPEGDRLFAETSGGVVKVFTVPSWTETPWQAPHGDRLRSMAISRDGHLLALFGFDNTFSLWNVDEPSDPRRFTLDWYTGGMTGAIAISPDARWLAIGQNDRIRMVDVESLEEKFQFETTDLVVSVDFSPDGNFVASGTGFQDPTVSLWSLETRQLARRLKGHTLYLRRVLFSPDGRLLASAAADQTVRLWSTETWTEAATLRGHQQEVWAMAFASDGLTLASAAKDGEIRLWSVNVRPVKDWPLVVDKLRVNSASFSFDSTKIATGNYSGSVSLRDARDLKETRRLSELGTARRGVLFSPTQRLLAVGSSLGQITLLDPERPGETRQLQVNSSKELLPKAFSADGSKLMGVASLKNARQCIVWDVDTGGEISSWKLPNEMRGMAFSHNGDLVITGHANGSVTVWDVKHKRGELLGYRHSESVGDQGIAFFPDDGRLVSASWFGDVTTWDLNAQKILSRQFKMHMQAIHSITLSQDAKRMITGGSAGESVKLWDVATHREVAKLMGQGFTFQSVLISPDGNAILAINSSGNPHLWRAPSWQEMKAIEEQYPHH